MKYQFHINSNGKANRVKTRIILKGRSAGATTIGNMLVKYFAAKNLTVYKIKV